MIALRTHVGRVAKRDVRERESGTWWAQVTPTAAPPPNDAVVSLRVFPSPFSVVRHRHPCAILVVGTTRPGFVFRRTWGHWLWLAPSRLDSRDSSI